MGKAAEIKENKGIVSYHSITSRTELISSYISWENTITGVNNVGLRGINSWFGKSLQGTPEREYKPSLRERLALCPRQLRERI